MSGLLIRSRASNGELKARAEALEGGVWSALGFLNHTSAHARYYEDLLERHADCQLCLLDEETDELLAVATSVPLYCADPHNLPSEGWDWMVETAATRTDHRANVLGALAISVPPEHRSKGYARRMIAALRALAADKGLDALIAPVRPSAKARHPHVAIEDYIHWPDAKGRPYDPWLRSHLAEGGRLVGPCSRSMVVEQPVAFWEQWSEGPIRRSGDYAVDGALAPIRVDLDAGCGRYEEPNVWVTYQG